MKQKHNGAVLRSAARHACRIFLLIDCPMADAVGLRCVRCCTEHRYKPESLNRAEAIAAALKVARYVRPVLDAGGKLIRAELCHDCADDVFRDIAKHVRYMRDVASEDPVSGLRRYAYRMVDADTGQAIKVESLFDEDLDFRI